MSCLSSKSTKVLWAENFTILIEKERERQSYLFVVFHPWFSTRLKYEKIQSSSWKSVVIMWRNEGTARCRCLKCNDVWTLCGKKQAQKDKTHSGWHIYTGAQKHTDSRLHWRRMEVRDIACSHFYDTQDTNNKCVNVCFLCSSKKMGHRQDGFSWNNNKSQKFSFW